MFTKRSIIVVLVGVNLLLLGLLLLGTYSPAAAYAQSRGMPGNFVAVTAKAAGQNYDVLYLLDRQHRKLHAFYPQRAGGKKYGYGYGKFRDLKADFEQ